MEDFVSVNFGMSKDVYDYYSEYIRTKDEWNKVANKLLSTYDISALPSTREEKYTQRKVDITDENFISMYYQYGPKAKCCSLARLFAFGKDCDIFSMEEFKSLVQTNSGPVSAKTKKIKAITATMKELTSLLAINLPEYEKQDMFLKEVKDFLWSYREMLQEK